MPFRLKCSQYCVERVVKKCKRPDLMWIVVVGGFLVNFTFGISVATGNIIPYVISYTRLRSLDPNREVVTLSYAPWLLGAGQATQSLTMFLGGVLVKRIGLRFTVLTGCLIASGGMLLSAGAVKLSFWVVVLTYGLVGGAGAGIAQSATLDAALQWHPQHKGLALGIILAGFAMTPIIFIPIQTAFVNSGNLIPNYYPDGTAGYAYFDQPAVLDTVPFLFIFMGAILLVIQLIGNALVVKKRKLPKITGPRNCKTALKYVWVIFKPQAPRCCQRVHREEEASDEIVLYNSGQMEDNSKVQESDGKETLKENRAETEVSPPREVLPRKLLKRWDFHLLWLAYMILGGSETYITSVYKAFGETFIYSDRFLAIVGSLGSVGAFSAKITFGIIADHFDSKSTLAVVVSIAVVVMYNIYSCSAWSLIGGQAALAVSFFLVSGGLAGMRAVLPVCIAQWYGYGNFAVNYGILYTSNVPASILAMVLPPLLHPLLGWKGELMLVASLDFIALLLIILGGGRRRKNV